jgi:hypothetical protein
MSGVVVPDRQTHSLAESIPGLLESLKIPSLSGSKMLSTRIANKLYCTVYSMHFLCVCRDVFSGVTASCTSLEYCTCAYLYKK